jgi:hypothetical protein
MTWAWGTHIGKEYPRITIAVNYQPIEEEAPDVHVDKCGFVITVMSKAAPLEPWTPCRIPVQLMHELVRMLQEMVK